MNDLLPVRLQRLTAKINRPSDMELEILSREGMTEVFDLIATLGIGTDIQDAVEKHPQLQFYFTGIAAEIASELQQFEELDYAKWWAHSRRYARFYTGGKQSKDTEAAVKDAVIWMFSDERASDKAGSERIMLHVHRGYLIDELPSTSAADKALAAMLPTARAADLAALTQHAWQYRDIGLTYETMQQTYARMREELAKAQALVTVLGQRGYRLGNLVSLLRS